MSRFIDRMERFEQRLHENDIEAAVISSGPNLHYLTGFAGEADRHVLFLIMAAGTRTFVSPEAYVAQVTENARCGEIHAVPDNTVVHIVDGLCDVWDEQEGRMLLDRGLPTGISYTIRERVPHATFGLADSLLEPMRLRKDAHELAALRRSAAIADEVSESIRAYGSDAIGLTESELAEIIRAQLHRKGGRGVAFPVVVAAGPNGARPTQYRHGDHEIRPGAPVVLDFGTFYDHYASDQTRVVVFAGDPPARFTAVHEAVSAALAAGVDAVRPGVTAAEIDATVRSVLEDHGYGDQFTTATGHGVGLCAHESPSISPDSKTILEEGMVFSIEPGVYRTGEFGVRLETIVAVTENGAEQLNDSSLSWRPSS